MGHVILLGDSILDNARYVPGAPPVIEQLRSTLPEGWQATLLAVDGDTTGGVEHQLRGLPDDATHLVISAGGNDAIARSGILDGDVRTVSEAMAIMQMVRNRFRDAYRTMLQALSATGKPSTVCTIYDAIPGLGPGQLAALACFNEVILLEAARDGLPVVDLRLVCGEPGDYSSLSPIEPSEAGGAKIVRVIAEVVTSHEFGRHRSALYT
jgi:hypothetical protein